MSTPRLLPGPSSYDARAEAQEGEHRLREEVRRWKEKAEINEDLLRQERTKSGNLARIISNLQQQLSPLYNGLRMVFGELNAAEVTAEATPSYQTNANTSFWETQKRRFPGRGADIIDLLLERPMTVMQIVTAGRMDRKTIYNHIGKLTKAGLVTNSGGVFSLTRQ